MISLFGYFYFFSKDARWKDQANAYYIHNLASTPYQKGTGKLFFSYLEDFPSFTSTVFSVHSPLFSGT